MTKKDLKPCPFCGHEAHWILLNQWCDNEHTVIICTNLASCGAQVHFRKPGERGFGEKVIKNQEEVMERWNQRLFAMNVTQNGNNSACIANVGTLHIGI